MGCDKPPTKRVLRGLRVLSILRGNQLPVRQAHITVFRISRGMSLIFKYFKYLKHVAKQNNMSTIKWDFGGSIELIREGKHSFIGRSM